MPDAEMNASYLGDTAVVGGGAEIPDLVRSRPKGALPEWPHSPDGGEIEEPCVFTRERGGPPPAEVH